GRVRGGGRGGVGGEDQGDQGRVGGGGDRRQPLRRPHPRREGAAQVLDGVAASARMRACPTASRTSSPPISAACSSASTPASARPRPATISPTPATTSGGCCTTPASHPACSTPPTRTSCWATGSASPTPPARPP